MPGAPSLLFLLALAPPDGRLAQLEHQAAEALRRQDPAAAAQFAQQGLRLDPDWKSGLWTAGSLLYELDRFAEALPHLERLTKLDPARAAPWALLGLCEMELGRIPQAAGHLRRGLGIGLPGDPDLQDVTKFQFALTQIHLERYEAALGLLRDFVMKERHGDELILALGAAALRVAPTPQNDSGLLRTVGEAQYQAFHHNDAAADRIYADLAAQGVRAPNVHYSFAFQLLDRNDWEGATRELLLELEVVPQSIPALLGLGYLGVQTGEHQKFLSYAREAVLLAPASHLAHLYLGRLLMMAGEKAAGLKEIEISRDLAPNNSRVRYLLAQAYRSAGRPAEAAREHEEFEKLRPADESWKRYRRLPASAFESEREH